VPGDDIKVDVYELKPPGAVFLRTIGYRGNAYFTSSVPPAN
jgi:hypothetical protein